MPSSLRSRALKWIQRKGNCQGPSGVCGDMAGAGAGPPSEPSDPSAGSGCSEVEWLFLESAFPAGLDVTRQQAA